MCPVRNASGVGIFSNEAERLKRLAGYSDAVVLARVLSIDTLTSQAGDSTVTRSFLKLAVERSLLGPVHDSVLVVEGPGNTSAYMRSLTLKMLAARTHLFPGSRQIFMLQVDTHRRLRLLQGGLLDVSGDTVGHESQWGGRRYADNVAKPLLERGIQVGAELHVAQLAEWLALVERERLAGLRAHKATLVAGAVLLGPEAGCRLPEDVTCFFARIDTVFAVDLDSLRSADRQPPLPLDPGSPAALTFVEGAARGQVIRVMLSKSARSWSGAPACLWLEPGPGNLWVPAYEGAGFQPVIDGVFVRTGNRGSP